MALMGHHRGVTVKQSYGSRSMLIDRSNAKDRARFLLLYYESLLSKIYRRDTRDSSSLV